MTRPGKIISGGQTGVDRAALDFAIERGIQWGGWAPKGWRSEDGTIPERPLGRKSDDAETIALCTVAHRQRTDHCGPFRNFTREDMRAFVAQALADTADAWRRHNAAERRIEVP